MGTPPPKWLGIFHGVTIAWAGGWPHINCAILRKLNQNITTFIYMVELYKELLNECAWSTCGYMRCRSDSGTAAVTFRHRSMTIPPCVWALPVYPAWLEIGEFATLAKWSCFWVETTNLSSRSGVLGLFGQHSGPLPLSWGQTSSRKTGRGRFGSK